MRGQGSYALHRTRKEELRRAVCDINRTERQTARSGKETEKEMPSSHRRVRMTACMPGDAPAGGPHHGLHTSESSVKYSIQFNKQVASRQEQHQCDHGRDDTHS